MRYQGSKAKVVAELLRHLDVQPGQYYAEPFVGGGNVIAQVNPAAGRIGYDINPHMVELLKALARGWVPPEHVSEAEYQDIKANPGDYTQHLVGYVGSQASFGGCWFGGYARGYKSDRSPRDMANEAWRNVMRQAPLLRGCEFLCGDYRSCRPCVPAIIYCDPPYGGTTGYAGLTFNTAEFWAWAKGMSDEGHHVFVSEYEAPEGWRCVWSKQVDGFNSIRREKEVERKHPTEKLFVRNEEFIDANLV